MPSPLRLLTALVVAAAACVALAATAGADSIVYVKDGNVWLTSPDASKQYQVTFDGGYSSPSQADDGTIVALRARQFVRMDRSGHLRNAPIDAIGTSGGNFYGPYEPRVSPDGTRIAYWFGQYSSYYSYGCYCYLFHLESKTAWSYADHFTDPTSESENYLGIEQPEWLTNDRLLASYPDFWMSGWTFKLGYRRRRVPPRSGGTSSRTTRATTTSRPIRRSARTARSSRSPTAATRPPRARSSWPACPGPRGWAIPRTRTTTSATAPSSSPSCSARRRRASSSTRRGPRTPAAWPTARPTASTSWASRPTGTARG